MDIKAYIESGILEAYALGALQPEEVQAVQEVLAEYPEALQELNTIENALLTLAEQNAIHPPHNLQTQIWNTLQNLAPATNPPNTIPLPPLQAKFKWQYAALWVGLISSIALNVYSTLTLNKNNDALALSMKQLKQDSLQLASKLHYYEKNKSMMADNETTTIVLHTVLKGHPMAATLYCCKSKHEAYIMMDGLPQPPHGMQYQLWAMKNGKPVNMGVFPTAMANTPTIQKIDMPFIEGEAYAISLEKMGGSPTPTLDNIYVMGKA